MTLIQTDLLSQRNRKSIEISFIILKFHSGTWKIFNGNEIGVLLAHWVWTQHKERNPNIDPSRRKYSKHSPFLGTCVVLNTTVSSKMLKAIADKEGLTYEVTKHHLDLNFEGNFDWLQMDRKSRGRVQEERENFPVCLRRSNRYFKPRLPNIYPLIGFMVGDICLDKDGIRGGVVFAEMAVYINSKGMTCLDHLREMYKT